jgi:protoheme IX farnesyltransferase
MIAVGRGLAGQTSAAARPGDFFALLKPRVMSLVVFTGAAGLLVAPGTIDPVIGFVAVLCIAVGSGAAGAINMWYDADIDAGMARTRARPIPQGRIAPGDALGFGVTLAIGSVAWMGLAVGWLAAGVLAGAVLFYVLVYTMWLKRRTPQNIVIGGAAGAFPPVIGWVAVTGQVNLEALVLFAIIFMWTPPHFWALALYRSDEYARVGVPMLPVVAGLQETRRQILYYSVALVPVTLLPGALGMAGPLYTVGAAGLGAVFVFGAVRVLTRRDERSARQLFGYSIYYLFVLFALLTVDALLGAGA